MFSSDARNRFGLLCGLGYGFCRSRISRNLGTIDFKNRRGSRSSGSFSLLVLDAGNGIRQQHTGSLSHVQFRVSRGNGIGDFAKRVGFPLNGANLTHGLRCIGVHPNLVGRLTKFARSQTSLVMQPSFTSVNAGFVVLTDSLNFVVHVSDKLHEVFQSHLGLFWTAQTHGTQDLIGVRQSRIVILLASLFLSEDVLAHNERNAIQAHVVAGGMCILYSLQQTLSHLQSTHLLGGDVEQTRFSMLEDFLSHLQVATIWGNLGHHQIVLNSFLAFRRCQSSFTQINGLRGWHFGHCLHDLVVGLDQGRRLHGTSHSIIHCTYSQHRRMIFRQRFPGSRIGIHHLIETGDLVVQGISRSQKICIRFWIELTDQSRHALDGLDTSVGIPHCINQGLRCTCLDQLSGIKGHSLNQRTNVLAVAFGHSSHDFRSQGSY